MMIKLDVFIERRIIKNSIMNSPVILMNNRIAFEPMYGSSRGLY